jgi:S1-C subfamily serine protease
MPKSSSTDDRLEFSPQQYWIARMVPMLYITALTIALPAILNPTLLADLTATQEQKLYQKLRAISIKVLAHGEAIGSGVLVDRQQAPTLTTPAPLQTKISHIYTVITNAHVIQAASAPFQIQTPDGQIHAAALVTPPVTQNRDLTVLRFHSAHRVYPTATLASASPKVGDRVWSGGFPLAGSTPAPEDRPDPAQTPWGLNTVNGRVTQMLSTALAGGYSIGLDYEIAKGMSGGPALDRSGELVGINGIHANPLWDTPETLEDGSTVSDALQKQIANSSWAIPIEFVKAYIQF